jgi:hypothetical protein
MSSKPTDEQKARRRKRPVWVRIEVWLLIVRIALLIARLLG